MAGQRRGTRRDFPGRRAEWLRLLAVVAGIHLLGCTAGERAQAPTFPGPPGGSPGGGGGGGGGPIDGGGGSNPVAQLAGRWENVTLFETVGDILNITTTWNFGRDLGCSRTTRSLSLLEGFPRTTQTSCHYQVVSFALDVTFSGMTAPVRYPYNFVALSPTRLLLGGLEYHKLP